MDFGQEEADVLAKFAGLEIEQNDILRFIFTNPNLERFMDFDENKEDE